MDDIIEGQVAKMQASASAEQPAATPTKQEAQTPTTGQAAPTGTAPKESEWDGDVNKLPPELQPWAKKVQAGVSKKLMDAAELRRKSEEYDQFVSSEEWQKYQSWKAQPQGQPSTASQPQQPVMVSQQEWEDAQLDPTGEKFASLVNRIADAKLAEKEKLISSELRDIRTATQKRDFKEAVSAFADVNPDVVEMHELGLWKPFVDAEMRSGQHKTHESMLSAAYEKTSAIRQKLAEQELVKSQGRIAEKKGASIHTGVTTGDSDVVFVDRQDQSLDAALENALQNKKVKIKVKK